MQQHMRHVYSQISIQKAERSRKMALLRSEKAIVLQTLVRGHLERRRHRGLLRHFERSMDLNRREISLREKERTG
jgi:predicted Zn-dependent protease